MDEFFRIAIEILKAVLPDSDFGKLLALLLCGLFALILFGRVKLEWLGHGIRHIFRWLRCKLRDKHLYHQAGLISWLDPDTGRQRGRFVCRVCGKVLVVN